MLSMGFLYSSYYKDSKKKMDSELKVQDQRWRQRRVDSLLTQNNNLFETETCQKLTPRAASFICQSVLLTLYN